MLNYTHNITDRCDKCPKPCECPSHPDAPDTDMPMPVIDEECWDCCKVTIDTLVKSIQVIDCYLAESGVSDMNKAYYGFECKFPEEDVLEISRINSLLDRVLQQKNNNLEECISCVDLKLLVEKVKTITKTCLNCKTFEPPISVVDPCKDVICPDGHTCVYGECVPPCDICEIEINCDYCLIEINYDYYL